MRLEVSIFRYLSKDDFRVLTSIEMGHKNHEYVPTQLIECIAKLRRGGCRKVLSNLLKHKLIAHDGKKYDGYKLTYNGYDFLALKAFISRGHIADVGIRMGVGKEADIHVCWSPEGKKMALKLHRLGRISFRTIKNNRDYLQHRKNASWQYMSRLAATKEYAYNKALSEAGFRVPHAIDHNRHAILMEFVEAYPLYQMRFLRNPGRVMEGLFKLLVRLGKAGLIHGDFNEFNLMINADEKITLIDFPQIVMMDHPNGDFYFSRDVNCVRAFFKKRFGIIADEFPTYEEVMAEMKENNYSNNVSGELSGSRSSRINDDEEDEPAARRIHVEKLDDEDLLMGAIAEEQELNNAGEKEEDGEEGSSEDDVDEFSDDDEEDEEEQEEDETLGRTPLLDLQDEFDRLGEEEDDVDDEAEEPVEDFYAGNGRLRDPRAKIDILAPSKKTALMFDSAYNINDDEVGEVDDTEEGTADNRRRSRRTPAKTDSTDAKGDQKDGEENDDKDEEEDDENESSDDEDEKEVVPVSNQIHVLQRKKKKRLTPEEIREKMKKKESSMKIKNCNKQKSIRKMKDETKHACKDLGY